MQKGFYTTIVLVFISICSVFAQIPNGYYDGTEGKIADDLKQSLNEIIKGHTEMSYGEARYILEESDLAIGSSDSLSTLYTYHKVKATWDSGETWNREHVWSKSRGFDVNVSNSHRGVGSDIHNLRACIPSINSAKSNRWFAECSDPYYFGDDFTGTYTNNQGGDANWLWEPRDEDKGDVARIIFYMATRYEGNDDEVDLEILDFIPGNKFSTSPIYSLLSDLLIWHEQDPVDDFELRRNNIIFESQNNRNPFIDRPEFAALVFSTQFYNASTMPSIPGTSDDVDVAVDISCANELAQVILKWGLSEGATDNSIIMSLQRGNTYKTESKIPAQNSGLVFYKVEATDLFIKKYESPTYSYMVSSGVLLSENFESIESNEDIDLVGWTNFNDLGSKKWIGKVLDDNKYAQFSSYGSGEENTGWLISPTLNLDETINEKFSFDVNVGYWKHSALSVYISSDFSGNVSEATWVDATESFIIPQEPTNDYGTFQSAGIMDISDYSGSINIAFKYNGVDPGETTTVQIDNVFVAGEGTAIAENRIKAIGVYPNPAREVLNFNKSFSNANIAIYNVLGIQVKSRVLSGNSISLADLPGGQYLVMVIDNNELYNARFIIER